MLGVYVAVMVVAVLTILLKAPLGALQLASVLTPNKVPTTVIDPPEQTLISTPASTVANVPTLNFKAPLDEVLPHALFAITLTF